MKVSSLLLKLCGTCTNDFLFYEQEFYCNRVELNSKDNTFVRIHSTVKLDMVDRKAKLNDGGTITYDECVIATGKHFMPNEICLKKSQ